MTIPYAKLVEFRQIVRKLVQSKYAVVIAEVFLMTLLTFSSFSILVRLTDVKTIGLWVLLNSLLSFSKMADFWSAGLVTFVAEEVERQSQDKAARLVSTAMVTGAVGFLVMALIAVPLLYAFAGLIPGVEDFRLVQRVVPLMGITFWLTTVAVTYQVGFLGFDRPVFKLMQNVGGSLVFLVLSIALVPHYGLWGILVAQASQGFLMLLFGGLVFHGIVAPAESRLRWNGADFKRLTRYGSKATLVGVLNIATDPLIRLLMSHFGGLGAVTLMELATRMIVAVRGLIMSVGQLLVPAFARSSVDNIAATAKLYAKAMRAFTLVTIPVLSCLLALTPLLEHVLLAQRTALFLPMVWVLSLGWGVNIITAPAFFLLTGLRRLRPLFWNRLLMLLAVFVFGSAGGVMWGVVGVTLGVTTGLALGSLVVLIAAREFDIEGSGYALQWPLALPIALAALTNVASLNLETHGYGIAAVATAAILGCLVTGLSSIYALPLRSLFITLRQD